MNQYSAMSCLMRVVPLRKQAANDSCKDIATSCNTQRIVHSIYNDWNRSTISSIYDPDYVTLIDDDRLECHSDSFERVDKGFRRTTWSDLLSQKRHVQGFEECMQFPWMWSEHERTMCCTLYTVFRDHFSECGNCIGIENCRQSTSQDFENLFFMPLSPPGTSGYRLITLCKQLPRYHLLGLQ